MPATTTVLREPIAVGRSGITSHLSVIVGNYTPQRKHFSQEIYSEIPKPALV